MSSPSFVVALKVTVLNALTPAGAVNMFVEMARIRGRGHVTRDDGWMLPRGTAHAESALTWIISSNLNSRSEIKKRFRSETMLGFGGSPKILAGARGTSARAEKTLHRPRNSTKRLLGGSNFGVSRAAVLQAATSRRPKGGYCPPFGRSPRDCLDRRDVRPEHKGMGGVPLHSPVTNYSLGRH